MRDAKKPIALMGAMPEEIRAILPLIRGARKIKLAGRIYHTGSINGRRVMAVVSGVGKVSAAHTAAALIYKFGVGEIIFTGSAGAISGKLKIGDIVLGKRFIQHDVDEKFLLRRDGAVPILGGTFLPAPTPAFKRAKTLLAKFAKTYPARPQLYAGDTASGDAFFATRAQKNNLKRKLPTVMCVEMEGAAVAQICWENKIPFTIIRVISDAADSKSPVDFDNFVKTTVSAYCAEIIKLFFAPGR